jgi:hypothetical protein
MKVWSLPGKVIAVKRNTVVAQSGKNILGAIALLDLEKGNCLISYVTSKLSSDTVAITNYSYDYRNTVIGPFEHENVLTLDYILT